MPTPKLPDELLIETVRIWNEAGRNVTEASIKAGVIRQTFDSRLGVAAKRGLIDRAPVMPGFEIKSVSTSIKDGEVEREYIRQAPEGGEAFEIESGFAVKYKTVAVEGGRVSREWVRLDKETLDPVIVAEKIRTTFDGMTFEAPTVEPPVSVNHDCLSLFNVPDAHLGLYVWGDEASENWDLKKADRVYREAFADLVSRTPHNSIAVILAGGDQLHADNSQNRTPQSGNQLDVDGRFERVLEVACELFLFMTLCALQTHERVIVRILKGNHDPHASAAIAYFLLASFRNEPRVTVDVSPSLFWVHQFGKVMIAATHGHEAKARDMPGIMAARWPEIWGATQFRFAHTFHVHHRSKPVPMDEFSGAQVETHHSPAPQDSWHYGKGFNSGRSLRSIVYHKHVGEFGGVVKPILPE